MADGSEKQDLYRESGLLDLLADLLVDQLLANTEQEAADDPEE